MRIQMIPGVDKASFRQSHQWKYFDFFLQNKLSRNHTIHKMKYMCTHNFNQIRFFFLKRHINSQLKIIFSFIFFVGFFLLFFSFLYFNFKWKCEKLCIESWQLSSESVEIPIILLCSYNFSFSIYRTFLYMLPLHSRFPLLIKKLLLSFVCTFKCRWQERKLSPLQFCLFFDFLEKVNTVFLF